MIYNTYSNILGLGDFVIGLFLGIAILIIVTWFTKIKTPLPSFRYRKHLTNLYVAGRIKQLARKDDVDLDVEEKEFLKTLEKSNKKRIKELDEKIEQELIDKVEETLKDNSKS